MDAIILESTGEILYRPHGEHGHVTGDGCISSVLPMCSPTPPRAATSPVVKNLAGTFTSALEQGYHNGVSFKSWQHFGDHVEMYHVEGTMTVYQHCVQFKGCRGVASLAALAASLRLDSASASVHMGVFGSSVGRKVHTGLGCFLENRLANRFRCMRVCGRIIDMSNVIKLRIDHFDVAEMPFLSGLAVPMCADVLISGNGSINIRMSWDRCPWDEEVERGVLSFCGWLTGVDAPLVDLRLAFNYLPACLCAAQSLALSFALCALHAFRLAPGYVACAMCLAVDRIHAHTRILDGNSVLLGIFLSHVVSEIQEFGTDDWHSWPNIHWIPSILWPLTAGYLMVYGAPITMAGRGLERLAFVGSCVHVAAFAYQRAESPEPRAVRVGRYMAFSLICIGWMYVVGIYRRRVTHVATDSAVHFAVYFWPILYIHPYASVAYSVAAVVSIVAHFRAPTSAPALSEPSSCDADGGEGGGEAPRRVLQYCKPSVHPPCLAVEVQPQVVESAVVDCEESMEELERAFRLALLSKAGAAP